MAERRMLAKTIIDSDAFIEMPTSSQLLYFHLHMRADDEGFINKPKMIMRMLGAKDDDMNILIAKKFVIVFESGVVVIKHWRIHNYLQNGRFIETKYTDEKSQLELDDNNAYRKITGRLPVKHRKITGKTPEIYLSSIEKSSIEKSSIENNSAKSKRFMPPTIDELSQFVKEEQLNVDPQYFLDYYESNGWLVGRNKMKDWKATVRNWSRKQFNQVKRFTNQRIEMVSDYSQPIVELSPEELDAIKNKFKELGGR